MEAIALLLLLALASGGKPAPGEKGAGPYPKGAKAVREQARRAGMDESWVTFLAAVAHHESRWNPRVAFGDPTQAIIPPDVKLNTKPESLARHESQAGLVALKRNRERGDMGYPPGRYAYSGGWFGILPANGLYAAFKGTEGSSMDPWVVFDPWISTLMAIGYAQGLMGWKSFRRGPRSWLSLNRGWKHPGKMDEAMDGTDNRFFKALKAIGVPASFAHEKVTSLPDDWHAWTYLNSGGLQA